MQKFFEELKQCIIKSNQGSFTSTSIRNQLRIPISSVKRYHAALLASGMIRKTESRNTKAYHFEIVSKEEYLQLQSSISNALDEALHKVKQLNGSTSARKQNELKKRKPVKELEEQPTVI